MPLTFALRRAAAALVLFATVLAALDAAMLKVWHPYWGSALPPVKSIQFDCSVTGDCYSTRPGWAIPVAIAIGLAGLLVVTLLYRPRPIGLVAALRHRPRPHL